MDMSIIFRTTKEMLGLNDHDLIDIDLQEMLEEAELLSNKCGGNIRSRQIIASIIVFWKYKYR